MYSTCKYAAHMPKMIQIRNVPDDIHKTLKSRAALAGMSLSEFILAEMRLLAGRPTFDELRERVHRRTKVEGFPSAADLVRQERDSR
jgi:plasmid stability protein